MCAELVRGDAHTPSVTAQKQLQKVEAPQNAPFGTMLAMELWKDFLRPSRFQGKSCKEKAPPP
jgi:hypothetical protein